MNQEVGACQETNCIPKRKYSMEDLREIYSTQFSISNVENLSIEAALHHIGTLIDLSLDLGEKDGLRKAIQLSKDLQHHCLSNIQECLLNYFLGNAWNNLKRLSKNLDDKERKEWENEEDEQEIIHLRKALSGKGFNQIGIDRQCQILTNLGNIMDEVGRPIESIEYKNKALDLIPSFPMAIGNKGICLFHYGNMLYDVGHKIVFFKFAHSNLKTALSLELHPSARSAFKKYAEIIESLLMPDELKEYIDVDNSSLGDTEDEARYRKWVLDSKLFLNPLNDLGPYPIASQDVLGPPPIVAPINSGVNYIGYFNQLKQEFISARYLFYEGITTHHPHFSDKDAHIFNTYDFSSCSLSSEKMKIAFRSSYSIFDKIAYLLNSYLNLFIKYDSVTFRTMWYNNNKTSKVLRKKFQHRNNWPLLGLFWLSKDLFEEMFEDTIEPEARKLLEIRNNIEHRYFKLHNKRLFESYFLFSVGLNDPLAYSMYRPEFEEKTLKLLKLVRAALIYLSLSIHVEELSKKKSRTQDRTIDEELDVLDDSYRI